MLEYLYLVNPKQHFWLLIYLALEILDGLARFLDLN